MSDDGWTTHKLPDQLMPGSAIEKLREQAVEQIKRMEEARPHASAEAAVALDYHLSDMKRWLELAEHALAWYHIIPVSFYEDQL